MKAEVNKDLCIGCGACCATTDGKVFKFSDEGYATAIENVKLEGELLEKAKEAEEGCPTAAISVKED